MGGEAGGERGEVGGEGRERQRLRRGRLLELPRVRGVRGQDRRVVGRVAADGGEARRGRGAGRGGRRGGEEEGEGREEEEREQRCEGRATRRGWPEQMVIEIGLAMVEEERKREEVGNDEWGSHVTLPETVRLPCVQRFAVEKFAIFSTLVSLIEFLGD